MGQLKTNGMRDMILLDILEDHLEEVDFFWSQREQALGGIGSATSVVLQRSESACWRISMDWCWRISVRRSGWVFTFSFWTALSFSLWGPE